MCFSVAESRSEILNNPDRFLFPTTGPYMCEICHVIIVTRQGFVNHISKKHYELLDLDVFEIMERRLEDTKYKKRKSETVAMSEPPPSKVSPGVTFTKKHTTRYFNLSLDIEFRRLSNIRRLNSKHSLFLNFFVQFSNCHHSNTVGI